MVNVSSSEENFSERVSSQENAFISKGSFRKELLDRKTPWKSVYVVSFLLLLTGLQMSIYFTSTWQYLSEVSEDAETFLQIKKRPDSIPS